MAKQPTEKRAQIQIGVDPLNKDLEQVKVYQKDGVTVRVKIGKLTTVPLWVAESAKRAGDIESFELVN
ncbi:MAG: hypothetical protein M0Q41_10745 [Bacteroidales bacterium]|nr:hypothetical protein [Acholeplasmataceae bacterium]MCK9449439.1 hypothetical protein [Bacteroidales bacterium]